MAFKDDYFQSADKAVAETRLLVKLKKSFSFLVPGFYKRAREDYEHVFYSEKWKPLLGCRRVLEVGLGEGAFLSNAPDGVEVVGIDVIDSSVKAAREKGFSAFKADCRKTRFPPASFDGVHCAHVLEHLPDPYAALKEFKRLLKLGGRLVFRVPNYNGASFYDDPTHVYPFTPLRAYRLALDSGFSVESAGWGAVQHATLFAPLTFLPSIRLFAEKIAGRLTRSEIVVIAKKGGKTIS